MLSSWPELGKAILILIYLFLVTQEAYVTFPANAG
jgi:hypothetical protein